MSDRRLSRCWRALLASVLLLLLSACAVSPAKRQAADELVAHFHAEASIGQPEGQAWPLPALEPVDDGRHRLVLIDRGDDSLAMRLHLIRTATRSIDIQNYIFLLDDSGELLLDELIAAAHRGVRVRLLVDSLFSLPDETLLASLELIHPNFELRLYRPILNQAVVTDAEFLSAIFCCFGALNQRMHNKLMVVDGVHGLIGGRNYSARYFDLDTRMVFLDIETLVSGPVVTDMRRGFDQFWADQQVVPPRYTRRVNRGLLESPSTSVNLTRSARLEALNEQFSDGAWLNRLKEEQGYWVDSVSYFSDLPSDRALWEDPPEDDSTSVIHALIAAAEREVVIQSPYVVLSRRLTGVLKSLDPEVRLTISSNSLASTDAFPVYAVSRKQRTFLLERLGVEFFELKPYPPDPARFVPRYSDLIKERAAGIATPMRGDVPLPTREMPGPRLSLHGKLLVIDGRYSVVTSHNLDPRSESWNTENGIVVDDPAFAEALLRYVDQVTDPANSWVSALQPTSGGVLSSINRTGAALSRKLPILDIWPDYRFEQFDVNGDQTVPVGLSPEVAAWQRRWITSMVSRMMGFLRPIL